MRLQHGRGDVAESFLGRAEALEGPPGMEWLFLFKPSGPGHNTVRPIIDGGGAGVAKGTGQPQQQRLKTVGARRERRAARR
jgi:hypothetical protein